MERGKLIGLNLMLFVMLVAIGFYSYMLLNGGNINVLRSPNSRNVLIAIGIGFIIVLILWIITFKNLLKESHVMMKM
ncbi:MAG TPA: hypothetical protein VJJ23_00105 [Candidatus Nanoarchaeia archaeon]|nr:hypothetical protein [Candidatus Nanoarchaeia archaeon]